MHAGSQPLISPAEVMMLPAEEMIVFVKGVRPMILERVGCHEIEPLRAGLGINPLHGKRFQGRLKVRM